MKTNKNNSNEVKQFAIGTKIEHDGYARNYYYTSHMMFPENGGGMQCYNDSFPDGKTQRRERRARAIKRRKGRL